MFFAPPLILSCFLGFRLSLFFFSFFFLVRSNITHSFWPKSAPNTWPVAKVGQICLSKVGQIRMISRSQPLRLPSMWRALSWANHFEDLARANAPHAVTRGVHDVHHDGTAEEKSVGERNRRGHIWKRKWRQRALHFSSHSRPGQENECKILSNGCEGAYDHVAVFSPSAGAFGLFSFVRVYLRPTHTCGQMEQGHGTKFVKPREGGRGSIDGADGLASSRTALRPSRTALR